MSQHPWARMLLFMNSPNTCFVLCPLPHRWHLLSQTQGFLWHPHPKRLNLRWRNNSLTAHKGFGTLFWMCLRHQHAVCTTTGGSSFLHGVGQILWCLKFLQSLLVSEWSQAIIKVYMATITAHHDLKDQMALGYHRLITDFMKGLHPPFGSGSAPCIEWLIWSSLWAYRVFWHQIALIKKHLLGGHIIC